MKKLGIVGGISDFRKFWFVSKTQVELLETTWCFIHTFSCSQLNSSTKKVEYYKQTLLSFE